MVCIHQYIVHILYKLSPELFIADWMSHQHHVENQDKEIAGMNVSIHTVNAAVGVKVKVYWISMNLTLNRLQNSVPHA